MFKIVWNACILLSVAMLSAVLTNKNNHEEFDNSMKDYVKKSTVYNSLQSCDNLGGEWIQTSFQNAERSVFFCKINTKTCTQKQ